MAYNTGLWGEDRGGVGAFYFGALSYDISAYVDKTLNFAENNFNFSASISSVGFEDGLVEYHDFTYGDYNIYSTTALSAQYSYSEKGTYTQVGVVGRVKDESNYTIFSKTDLSLIIVVNQLPNITFIGSPNAESLLTLQDDSQYYTGTIVSADWNFGDGNTSSTIDPTTSFEHSYSAKGNYTISVTAYDISGNTGIDTTVISILESSTCKAKENYITICGPEMLGRYGDCKKINLVEYLPLYLRGAETEDFLVLFEDFLNEMYSGLCGWQTSSTELTVNQSWSVSGNAPSATVNQDFIYDISGVSAKTDATTAEQLELHWPTNAAYATSAQRISILEKVARLTELHDPDLIDIEYIQFFAANLGYNINVSRDEIGNSGTNDNFGTTEIAGSCSATDINKYLRFVVQNLPTWYKIKTTRNAIKVMLYSFGLVGDIIEYFTKDYKDGGLWRADYNGDLEDIENNWFPTPHFAVFVDFDLSSDISFEISRRQKVIRAIESIRPINTVFRRLVGYVKRIMPLSVACYMRATRYVVIESNGYSNGWGS
jgi:PKD repeat protein